MQWMGICQGFADSFCHHGILVTAAGGLRQPHRALWAKFVELSVRDLNIKPSGWEHMEAFINSALSVQRVVLYA